MDQDREVLTGSELARWIIVAVLIIAGVALFFRFARSTQPVVPPTVQEPAR
jgi:hypothetical protein